MTGVLQDAINLIRQGKKLEGRALLEVLLRANPQDVASWFWYAETLETPEKRIKVLELCLQANPGNPQVEKALTILRARTAQAAPPFAPFQSKPVYDPDGQFDPLPDSEEAAGFAWQDEQTQAGGLAPQWSDEELQTEFSSPLRWDDDPRPESGIDWDSIEQQQAPKPEEQALETLPVGQKDLRPAYRFYNVWLKAISSSDVREYQALLQDKNASQGRAYEWLAYAGLISGLTLPILWLTGGFPQQAETRALLGDLSGPLVLVILGGAGALLGCVFSVLGLMISAGIQFLLAKALGGSGTYTRTVYAVSAYLAPITIISALLGLIPFVNCLSPILAIYTIVLNVRALKAAHSMNTSRAVLVIFIPSILIFMVACLLALFLAPALTDILSIENFR
ncbi:MAG: Yip1 family protein [Anaerolineales bacterium]|jgi:hypothetical protein|nr:Yip1 family protein [Anaerolineales bacterium]